jgi:hypothetical protein
MPARMSRRKLLLLQRAPYLRAWDSSFPAHDVMTLRPHRYRLDSFEAACDRAEAEAKTQPPSAAVQQARRRMQADISLDRLWHELNDPARRPTPAVVVEAIMHCVRERGVKALEGPANIERLNRCDAAALAQIDTRVAKLKGRGR